MALTQSLELATSSSRQESCETSLESGTSSIRQGSAGSGAGSPRSPRQRESSCERRTSLGSQGPSMTHIGSTLSTRSSYSGVKFKLEVGDEDTKPVWKLSAKPTKQKTSPRGIPGTTSNFGRRMSTVVAKDGHRMPVYGKEYRNDRRISRMESPRMTATLSTSRTEGLTPEPRMGLKRRSPYRAKLARRFAHFIHGAPWSAVMAMAILVGLFAPDLCIILGVRTDLELDLIMSMAAVLFIADSIMFSLVDTQYFLSVFFFMDIIGTLSMAFDVSFLFGSRANAPRAIPDSDLKIMVLLRAARAARIGARAGRLSRVLRIRRLGSLLGFRCTEDQTPGGVAFVISIHMANSVAPRLAKFFLLLLTAVAMFDFMSFAPSDHSLETWVGRLSEMHRREKSHAFQKELADMVEFFRRQSYGPYQACHGYLTSSGHFVCEQAVRSLKPDLSEPERMSSALLIHTDSLMVAFNMVNFDLFQAWLTVAYIVFIILSMVVCSISLSRAITLLAVRPVHRMFLTVRQIAAMMFKLDHEQVSQDNTATLMTSEINLLEKVVQRLRANVRFRNGGASAESTKDMQDEDIAILDMITNKQGNIDASRGHRGSTQAHLSTFSNVRNSTQSSALSVCRTEPPADGLAARFQNTPFDFGMTQEVYDSWNFNTLPLATGSLCTMGTFTLAHFHAAGEGFIQTPEDEKVLMKFMSRISKQYKPNPFHNFAHAVDVAHVVARMMRITNTQAYLNEVEQFSLLVAAIGHDVGHPGVNNDFLVEVEHELALVYNDRSPLENMHSATLFSVLADNEANVFDIMTLDECKAARATCIQAILHTDMVCHQAMVKDLQLIYQMNSEVFVRRVDTNEKKEATMEAEVEVFGQPEVKTTLMNVALHSADVSNPARGWEVTEVWANAILEEYFAQGDKEKHLGIPVQFLNDRDKLNKANSQIGFIEFMIAPFFAVQIYVWPGLHELGENLVINNARWAKMFFDEVDPAEEERQNILARVDRVKDLIDESMQRGAPS